MLTSFLNLANFDIAFHQHCLSFLCHIYQEFTFNILELSLIFGWNSFSPVFQSVSFSGASLFPVNRFELLLDVLLETLTSHLHSIYLINSLARTYTGWMFAFAVVSTFGSFAIFSLRLTPSTAPKFALILCCSHRYLLVQNSRNFLLAQLPLFICASRFRRKA